MDDTTNLEDDLPEVDDVLEVEEQEIDENEDQEIEGEDDESEPEDETEEIEYEGAKHRIPKALKDAFLRQADYTRKTQEVASMRKETEEVLRQAQQVSQAERQIEAHYSSNAEALAEYEKVDWRSWMQQDPQAAQAARMEYDDLHRRQQQLGNAYQQARSQRLAMEQQQSAKRIAEGQRVLAERIPDWNEDKARTILNEGQRTYGFSAEELNAIDDPRMILVLNDALEAAKGRKSAATKAKVERQQAVKPAQKVKGGATVIKGLDDRLSPDEWMKRREAQLAKR